MSLIRSDPKVENVEVNTRSCRVELAGEEVDVAAAVEATGGGRRGAGSFAEKEPTLEDVFMLVTKGLVT